MICGATGKHADKTVFPFGCYDCQYYSLLHHCSPYYMVAKLLLQKFLFFFQSAQSSALLCQFFVCTKVNFEPSFTTGCRDAPAVGSRFSKVKNNDMTDRTESRQNMQYLAPYYQLNQNIDWQRV